MEEDSTTNTSTAGTAAHDEQAAATHSTTPSQSSSISTTQRRSSRQSSRRNRIRRVVSFAASADERTTEASTTHSTSTNHQAEQTSSRRMFISDYFRSSSSSSSSSSTLVAASNCDSKQRGSVSDDDTAFTANQIRQHLSLSSVVASESDDIVDVESDTDANADIVPDTTMPTTIVASADDIEPYLSSSDASDVPDDASNTSCRLLDRRYMECFGRPCMPFRLKQLQRLRTEPYIHVGMLPFSFLASSRQINGPHLISRAVLRKTPNICSIEFDKYGSLFAVAYSNGLVHVFDFDLCIASHTCSVRNQLPMQSVVPHSSSLFSNHYVFEQEERQHPTKPGALDSALIVDLHTQFQHSSRLRWSPTKSEHILLSSSTKTEIRAYDLERQTVTPVAKLTRPSATAEGILDFQSIPAQQRVIGAGRDGNMYVWDIRSKPQSRVVLGHHESGIRSVCVPRTSEYVVSCHDSGACRLLDLRMAGAPSPVQNWNLWEARSLRLSHALLDPSDDAFLAYQTTDGTVGSFDIPMQRKRLEIESPVDDPHATNFRRRIPSFSQSGSVLACGSLSRLVRLVDMSEFYPNRTSAERLKSLPNSSQSLSSLDSAAISAGYTGFAEFYDARQHESTDVDLKQALHSIPPRVISAVELPEATTVATIHPSQPYIICSSVANRIRIIGPEIQAWKT
jgi:WD domain, G-beta repeat